MHNNLFDQILRLFHKFSVQPDMPYLVIATSPFSLHSLKEISFNLRIEFRFPLSDQDRDELIQERLAPFMDNFRSFSIVTACGRTVNVNLLWSAVTYGLASRSIAVSKCRRSQRTCQYLRHCPPNCAICRYAQVLSVPMQNRPTLAPERARSGHGG